MSTRQTIKRFVQPISYALKSYFFSVFCEVRDVFQSIFTIQLGVNIIQAIEQKNTEMMYYQARLLGSVFLVSLIISIGREISLEHTRNMIEYGIKKSYLGKFLHLNHTQVELLGTGKMQDIIMQGSFARQNILTGSGLSIILEALGILYAFTLIWYKSPSIQDFMIFTGIAILSFIFIIIGLQKLNNTRKQSKEINLELSRQEIKIIMSKFEVLQSNKFDHEMDNQLTLVKENIRIRQRGNFIKSLRQAGSVGLINGFQLYIYLGIGLSVITGQFTIAYILLLLQLLDTISTYIRQLRQHFKNFYREKTDVEKLRETFDTIPTIDHSSGTQFHSLGGGINFENVTFGYSSSANTILNTLSFTITGKQKTALVGPSGGGKSTLIKLIAGYLQPNSGSVIVDGQDLKDVSLLSYYKHIGYLTQEPSVFDGTIRENLEYGLTDNSQAQQSIETVIPLAKCERIYDLPNGLDTEIGERGVRLSGGQKQRLAIAKIMLKNPDIILLDEPTSALDSANEQAVTEALNNLFKNKTVIIIAHRLQTVKNADDIIYIADGKVIERGTHAELLALGGEYYTMVELQSGF